MSNETKSRKFPFSLSVQLLLLGNIYLYLFLVFPLCSLFVLLCQPHSLLHLIDIILKFYPVFIQMLKIDIHCCFSLPEFCQFFF